MGKTMVEKIFSSHAGHDVSANDIVVAKVDFALLHDVNAPAAIENFKQLGSGFDFDKKNIAIVLDHFSPCPTTISANSHKKIRSFAIESDIKLYEPGEGICHQLVLEDGYIKPSSINVATDSHTLSYGAVNAVGLGIGASEMAIVMAAGECWFKVPETILVELTGQLPAKVTAKDIALKIISLVTEKGAIYKNFEFKGDTLAQLSVDSRITICNMMVEMGAKCTIMPGDDILATWLDSAGIIYDGFVSADYDAKYIETIQIDVAKLRSVVAVSPNIDDVVAVVDMEKIKLDQVIIGSCTNGRFEDFALAADILKGKKAYDNLRLIIAPASRSIYKKMLTEGLLEQFLDAGAIINPPGCGPCAGLHGGLIGDGENVLSTTNRNMKGRMGSSKGDIYVSSPVVAAYSAIAGYITDGGVEK